MSQRKNPKWVDAGPKGIFRLDEVKAVKPLDGKVAVIGAGSVLIVSVEEEDVEDLNVFYNDVKCRLME